jgi:sRNA-binding protein
MPKIDIHKLRRFHANARAANAAAQEASRTATEARNAWVRAENALKDANKKDSRVSEVSKDRLADAVKDAAAKTARADEVLDRLQDEVRHATRLWERCRDYAAQRNVLPADLAERF